MLSQIKATSRPFLFVVVSWYISLACLIIFDTIVGEIAYRQTVVANCKLLMKVKVGFIQLSHLLTYTIQCQHKIYTAQLITYEQQI